MVSGLVTSPELQLLICLDEAREISIASKLFMSITWCPSGRWCESCNWGLGLVRKGGGARLALLAVGEIGALARLLGLAGAGRFGMPVCLPNRRLALRTVLYSGASSP